MSSPHPSPEDDVTRLLAVARAVLDIESRAVQSLVGAVDEAFGRAASFMLACQGRIVVLGMGKSGHIGGKIAATLASTGTPAFFVHPGEASHGDMGMITGDDVVLAPLEFRGDERARDSDPAHSPPRRTAHRDDGQS